MLMKRINSVALSNNTATRLANAFLLLVALSLTSSEGGAGAWRISRPTFRILRSSNPTESNIRLRPSVLRSYKYRPRIVRSKLLYRFREDRDEGNGDELRLLKSENQFNVTMPTTTIATLNSRRMKRRQRLLRFVPLIRRLKFRRRSSSSGEMTMNNDQDVIQALQNSTVLAEVPMTLNEMESFQASLSTQELQLDAEIEEELTAAMDQDVTFEFHTPLVQDDDEEEEESIGNDTFTFVSTTPPTTVSNAHELRSAVLDHQIPLKDVKFDVDYLKPTTRTPASTYLKQSIKKNPTPSKTSIPKTNTPTPTTPFSHPVLEIIESRTKSKSKPGNRSPSDTHHLALSIEGGGMRGAVSAGMASAVAVLGLSDAFDSVYGSSAGSVVGSYFVSRQMSIDVYTEVLTTAKAKFVSPTRLLSSLVTGLMDSAVNATKPLFSKYSRKNPAMNISYVIDDIMREDGVRPLNMDLFQANDKLQPLRVVSSTVRNGKLETHCFGSKDLDYFHVECQNGGGRLQNATTMVDGHRHGFYACLQTSMTVPTATGPPVPMIRNKDAQENITSLCFDAFCYEPIPYRSAVKEGATHVLVLKTRPDGDPIATKPGLFEKSFAPMYFDDNDLPQVSDYFERGGQQYIYAEDYLTLDEGRDAGGKGVLVPPPQILYGVDLDEVAQDLIKNRSNWKRAHLLPIAVPEGTQLLSSLSVDRGEIVQAVSEGFAIAFDLLAPVAGVELDSHLDGARIASLLFPDEAYLKNVLDNPVKASGNMIGSDDIDESMTLEDWRGRVFEAETTEVNSGSQNDPCSKRDALQLLHLLPGFQFGRMSTLSQGLTQLLDQE